MPVMADIIRRPPPTVVAMDLAYKAVRDNMMMILDVEGCFVEKKSVYKKRARHETFGQCDKDTQQQERTDDGAQKKGRWM